MKTLNFDLVIMGGGLAGLTLALQIKKQANISIAIVEKNKFPVPEAAHKVGESSVEVGAYYFSEIIGLKEHIKNEQLPKFGLRYFFPKGDNGKIEQRLEFGGNSFFPTPSFQLDRGRLENHLFELVKAAGITVYDGSKAKILSMAQNDFQIALENQEVKLASRWLVDSASRANLIKKEKDLKKECSHKACSAWFRVSEKIDVNSWCNSEKWLENNKNEKSRWYSTNHLLGKGYWVWLIPLASGCTSVGIVADPAIHPLNTYNTKEKALEWLKQYEPQCALEIEKRFDKIVDFLALKSFAHAAQQVFSTEGWFTTGEAGVFLDPFYSPGSDFIAMSNTYVSDLIIRASQGEDISQRTKIYDQMYLTYFENTIAVYNDQYPIFGHSAVMPLKVIWDYGVYWTQIAFIFVQGYLCDMSVFTHTRRHMSEIGRMNYEMQSKFREYIELVDPSQSTNMIDVTKIQYLYDLNKTLTDKLAPEEFVQTFKARVEKLIQLKGIIDSSLENLRTNSTATKAIEAEFANM